MNDPEPESLRGDGTPGGEPPGGNKATDRTRVGDLAVGTILFDRFELIAAPGREDSLVGQGGMGIIHLAKDSLLDRVVAIKLPPRNVILDEAAKLDLLVETRQALALTHPNIVRVYDFHESARDEMWGISMQYVNGINLSEMRARLSPGSRIRRPFTVERIRPWIRQICEALVHAHEFAGFVHRDLNPKNVMLEVRAAPGETDPREHILITDFGIAATIRHSMQKSGREDRRTAQGAGTLPYMPWEQIMGNRPSASDDIYALGATLYDLLTATPPFHDGPQDSILAQIERAIPPSMAERRRELGLATPDPIGAEWEEVVRDCLRKDPNQRPASVREVARRLGFDLPLQSSSPPPGDEPSRGMYPVGSASLSDTSPSTAPVTSKTGGTTKRSGGTYQSARTQRTESKRLAVVMFTDIVGSVALQQRLGTAAYTDFVAQHDLVVETALKGADDAEVLNETGDGFVVRFSEPSDAVETALRLQFLAAKTFVDGEPIRIRVGLHLGVITEMEERVRGETRRVGMVLNLAARVMDMAHPGQILLTRAVFDDARQFVRIHPHVEGWEELPPVVWMIHGDYLFKGNDDPLALFEVGAENIAPLVAPGDGAKGRKLAESGSDQVIKSLPQPPSAGDSVTTSRKGRLDPDLLKSEREQNERARAELETEIQRLRESETGRARELKLEADHLAAERIRLERLSDTLAARRDEEEKASRELRDRAREELHEAERRSAELTAAMAAEKAAFESEMAARSAEMEESANRKREALEAQERALLEAEQRLSEDRSSRSDQSLELVRVRERLNAERGEFEKEIAAKRQSFDEERVAYLARKEAEWERAEREIEEELARKDASHATALAELLSALAEQESELRRQSEELATAEERIREMQSEEQSPNGQNAALVSQLGREAHRFEDRIEHLNAELERIRRVQKRRLTLIAAGSVTLALIVGMVSAKLIWGFWPWKLFTAPAESQSNVVVEGLRQLEREGDWLGLLSATIPASRDARGRGDDGEIEVVASLSRHAMAALAAPPNREWEADPEPLLGFLEQIAGDKMPVSPIHAFLIAKIRVIQASRSERLAGIPEALRAYLACQSAPASPDHSAELDTDMTSLLSALLDAMDRGEILADEEVILREFAGIPEDTRSRLPLIGLVEGRLRIREYLRQRPPAFAEAMKELEDLEAGDPAAKARLLKPFEQIVALLEKAPTSLPSPESLVALATRWQDPRPLVVALENLEMEDPSFVSCATRLWRDFHINRAANAPPLPDEAQAWIGWLALTGSDQEGIAKGLGTLRNLAANGNAKAKFFLVNHYLGGKPNAKDDLEAWNVLAEAALEGGESGTLVQLGTIQWRISESAADPASKAASLEMARGYFRRAITECRRRPDRDSGVILLAATFAGSGAKGADEHREMADVALRAGIILWRGGQTELAEANWDKAWEADPDVTDRAIQKAIEATDSDETKSLKDALKAWRETKIPTPPDAEE